MDSTRALRSSGCSIRLGLYWRTANRAGHVTVSRYPLFSMAHAKTKEMDLSDVSEGVTTTVTKTAAAVEAVKRGPLKTFHQGDVWCNVHAFTRESKNGVRTNYSVTFSKSYRDKDNKWKHTSFFSVADLGTVVELAKNARTFVDSLNYPQPEPLPDQAD